MDEDRNMLSKGKKDAMTYRCRFCDEWHRGASYSVFGFSDRVSVTRNIPGQRVRADGPYCVDCADELAEVVARSMHGSEFDDERL